MFDPMQAYLAGAHQPIENYNNLDEEQYAMRHTHVARIPVPAERFSVRLGKLLIRVGEKLTGECTHVEFTRETA